MPQITQLPFIFTSQLFWLALAFGVIFFGIGRGMLPTIRSTVAVRDSKITEDLEKTTAARAAAAATEAEWRARLDNARIEAAQIAQQAKQASARETETQVKAALDEIDAKVERARLRIRAAVQAARVQMDVVAAEAAEQMVEKLTGLKIDRKDAAQAVAVEFKLLDGTVRRKQDPHAERDPERAVAMVR
jgi:F-type H+-transporting ATPase subunit b